MASTFPSVNDTLRDEERLLPSRLERIEESAPPIGQLASSWLSSNLRSIFGSLGWPEGAPADAFLIKVYLNARGHTSKKFLVSWNDHCYQVLDITLRQYGIKSVPREYALCMAFGSSPERRAWRLLGLAEQPVKLFGHHKQDGEAPMFILQKIGLLRGALQGRFDEAARLEMAGNLTVLSLGVSTSPSPSGRSPEMKPISLSSDSNSPKFVEIFKRFRVAMDDPTYKVLPEVLKK